MPRQITPAVYDENIRKESDQELIGKFYAPVHPPYARRIAAVIDALDPRPGDRVLDVGCGAGAFSFHSARRGAVVSGIDYSGESVRAARRLCERFAVSPAPRFVHGSALSLPYAAASFDKAVAADFIEHITDDEKDVLLGELRRVLVPGGSAVVFTPNLLREAAGERYARVRRMLTGRPVPVNDLHYGLITRRRFERMLRAHGFTYSFRYVDTTRPWLARLPLVRAALALDLLWTIRTPLP